MHVLMRIAMKTAKSKAGRRAGAMVAAAVVKHARPHVETAVQRTYARVGGAATRRRRARQHDPADPVDDVPPLLLRPEPLPTHEGDE